MKLFFDTETTGLVKFNEPYDGQQARLVQLAMLVMSDTNELIHEISMIVKPEGFFIPDFVAKIHGINNGLAFYGVSLKLALSIFNDLHEMCDTFIGHNIAFDRAIVASEMKRCGMRYQDRPTFCTMLQSTEICGLKGNHAGQKKWPKLTEAYRHFFGEELIGAHDALADVKATMRIYLELRRRASLKEICV